MKLVKPFGPDIGHDQLSDEDNQTLLEICLANKDDLSKRFNRNLSGYIECVFDITNDIPPKLINTIKKVIVDYANKATSSYPGSTIPANYTEISCLSAWCNVQKSREFHLIHSHPMNDLVCVIYPKVEISDEKSVYDEHMNSEIKPGSLILQHGENLNNFGSRYHTITPQEKDIYVFPADLSHCTTPIWNDNYTRISVAFNFVFNDLFYQRRKMRGYK